MIVLAQRWSDGPPSEKLGRWVVEALVLAPVAPESISYRLYSAFFDQGQTIDQAFNWWWRGVEGLPHSAINHAVHIVEGWAAPQEEVTALKDYVERMETLMRPIGQAILRMIP